MCKTKISFIKIRLNSIFEYIKTNVTLRIEKIIIPAIPL